MRINEEGGIKLFTQVLLLILIRRKIYTLTLVFQDFIYFVIDDLYLEKNNVERSCVTRKHVLFTLHFTRIGFQRRFT